MKIRDTARNAACDAIVDLVDGDDGSPAYTEGKLRIYTGSPPASPSSAVTGTLLVEIDLNDPSFDAAGTGSTGRADVITSPALTATITTSGTAGYFRFTDKDGLGIFDGNIGVSGKDLNFNSVTFVAGGTVTITSFYVTVPEGTFP